MSYSGDPADNTTDEVRFLIGDTDETDELLSDEEIGYALATLPSPVAAAAFCARTIAAKLTREYDSSKSVGDLSISRTLSARARNFRDLAAQLDKQATQLDPVYPRVSDDALGPEFYIGMHDNLEG